MAELVLIKPPARAGTRLEAGDTALVFDATPSETHTQDAEITQYPVEDGSDINDHVRPRPFTMRLSATLTATPMDEDEQQVDRLARKHAEMLDLVTSGATLRVVTGLVAYDNMVIASYQANRSVRGGQALQCDLDLQQVRRADSAEVDIPPGILGPRVRTDGQSPQSRGDQTGKAPDANEAARGKSWLATGVDFFF